MSDYILIHVNKQLQACGCVFVSAPDEQSAYNIFENNVKNNSFFTDIKQENTLICEAKKNAQLHFVKGHDKSLEPIGNEYIYWIGAYNSSINTRFKSSEKTTWESKSFQKYHNESSDLKDSINRITKEYYGTSVDFADTKKIFILQFKLGASIRTFLRKVTVNLSEV